MADNAVIKLLWARSVADQGDKTRTFASRIARRTIAAVISKCLLYSAVYLATTFCCTSLSPLSGTSEQGNARILASVYNSSGKPAAGMPVRLRRADFLSDTTAISPSNSWVFRNTSVNENGSVSIDSVDTGAYTLEINDNAAEATLFKFTIPRPGQTVQLGVDTLQPFAAIRGTVDIGKNAGKRYVQVEGLERIAVIDANGMYALNDLPAGTFTLRFPNMDSVVNHSILDTITVSPGQTVQISYSRWNYSKTLYLNTTASGADVGGTVCGFPLLIRLHADNFAFNQAKPDGGDLRFTKANGAPLPYEIEQWDAAKKQAAVWVKVDTVYGNNATQHIIMCWGNPNAAAQSNGAAVFDTATGFAGVWHLNEAGKNTASDATANHFNGTPYGTAAATATGTIGYARQFDGSTNYLRMHGTASGKLNFPQNGTYTLSAWIFADTINKKFHVIAAKSYRQYFIKLKWPDQAWEFTEWNDGEGDDMTRYGPPVAYAWKYLVGVRDGSRQYLYVDGKLVCNTISHYAQSLPRDTTQDFSIGGYLENVNNSEKDGYAFFSGTIDELRISGAALGADWIRLSYMNQKEIDKLVVIK